MLLDAIIYLLILCTALPFGLILAKLCEDELIKDRKYFFFISITLLIVSVIALIFSKSPSIILAPIYMILLLAVLMHKGKKFKSKRK